MLRFYAMKQKSLSTVSRLPAFRVLRMSDCGSRKTHQPSVGASAGCRPRRSRESYLSGLRLRTQRNALVNAQIV